MCGEHLGPRHRLCALGGSPPHVRGTHIIDNSFLTCYRITPACAGNTR